MKLIGRLLLYVLIACVVVIFGFYFLLQTRWGADHVSNRVSENSGYHLTFDVMDHRFSAPSHLLLENVTFGRDGQPAPLVAKQRLSPHIRRDGSSFFRPIPSFTGECDLWS
nr:hypothetical protein [Salmonella enterica]